MSPSRHVVVHVDLDRIRANAERVRREAGVDVLAVVKADAYGMGASRVADVVASAVDGFYVFELNEVAAAGLRRFGKPVIALLDESNDPRAYADAGVRPVVWTATRARALRSARPILSVDTGQQRFACPADDVDAVLRAGGITEAMTHATRPAQAVAFDALTAGRGLRRHAAGTALLPDPAARFDAVRPGLALYHDAVRVTVPLADARDAVGPAGYGGFVAPRFGVVLAGYAHGLRPGPCAVNGRRRAVVEVGMQSSFVTLGDSDRPGDAVELLGPNVPADDVAAAWATSPQEVLVRLCGMGVRAFASIA